MDSSKTTKERSSGTKTGATSGSKGNKAQAKKIDSVSGKEIVYRIEDNMDRQDVALTTYQMRNFYRQFGDGFFSVLDVMNYIQHHNIVLMAKPGDHVLDMCCGRGLVLPMLRYLRKKIGSYTGVDIASKNAQFLVKRVTDGKTIDKDYYPFPTAFFSANVAKMADVLPRNYDFIIYTSSIEHMHPEMGLASLHQVRKIVKRGAKMVITCPNTPENQDGYDTRYRAHVYEWKRSELLDGLKESRWKVISEFGLLIDKKTLKVWADANGFRSIVDQLSNYIPNEWLLPVMAPALPAKFSKEIGFIVEAY